MFPVKVPSKGSHCRPVCAFKVFHCSLNEMKFCCHKVQLVKNSHDQDSAKNRHCLKTKRLPAPHLQSHERWRPRCLTRCRTILLEHSASSHPSSLLLFQLPWKHQCQSNTDMATHSPSCSSKLYHSSKTSHFLKLMLCSLIAQDGWADSINVLPVISSRGGFG